MLWPTSEKINLQEERIKKLEGILSSDFVAFYTEFIPYSTIRRMYKGIIIVIATTGIGTLGGLWKFYQLATEQTREKVTSDIETKINNRVIEQSAISYYANQLDKKYSPRDSERYMAQLNATLVSTKALVELRLASEERDPYFSQPVATAELIEVRAEVNWLMRSYTQKLGANELTKPQSEALLHTVSALVSRSGGDDPEAYFYLKRAIGSCEDFAPAKLFLVRLLVKYITYTGNGNWKPISWPDGQLSPFENTGEIDSSMSDSKVSELRNKAAGEIAKQIVQLVDQVAEDVKKSRYDDPLLTRELNLAQVTRALCSLPGDKPIPNSLESEEAMHEYYVQTILGATKDSRYYYRLGLFFWYHMRDIEEKKDRDKLRIIAVHCEETAFKLDRKNVKALNNYLWFCTHDNVLDEKSSLSCLSLCTGPSFRLMTEKFETSDFTNISPINLSTAGEIHCSLGAKLLEKGGCPDAASRGKALLEWRTGFGFLNESVKDYYSQSYGWDKVSEGRDGLVKLLEDAKTSKIITDKEFQDVVNSVKPKVEKL